MRHKFKSADVYCDADLVHRGLVPFTIVAYLTSLVPSETTSGVVKALDPGRTTTHVLGRKTKVTGSPLG